MKLTKTRFNYWAEFVIDIPLGWALIITGLRISEYKFLAVLLTILLGMFLFSFFEYAIHRWLFHGSVRILAQGHQAHHDDPMAYLAQPFFLPALILLALASVFFLLMPPNYSLILTGTVALSYTTYGLSHFIIHHHRFHFIPARNWAALHHIHHYHADTNFGVTTPLWDLLIGTRYRYVGVKGGVDRKND